MSSLRSGGAGLAWLLALILAPHRVAAEPTVSAELPCDPPAVAPLEGTETMPGVAFNGSVWLVVWSHGSLGDQTIRAARVDVAGTLLDPEGIVVAIDGSPRVEVASDGSDFLVTWGYSVATAARVSASGVVLDSPPIVVADPPTTVVYPSVAFDGANYVAVWEDYATGFGTVNDVYATRIDPTGTVLDAPIPVAVAAGNQHDARVDCRVGGCLVTWFDGLNTVRAARMDPGGAVVDPAGITVAGGVATQNLTRQDVAWNGQSFVVVFSEPPHVKGVRIDAAGIALDATPFSVSAAGQIKLEPVISSGAPGTLAVWRDAMGNTNDIAGRRIDALGMPLDAGDIAVSQAWDFQFTPAVAAGADAHLVAWRDNRNAIDGDIYAARVSSAGVVLDGDGILVSGGPNVQRRPAIATDDTSWLVVWSDSRGEASDLYASRLDAAGAQIDPVAFSIAPAARRQDDARLASGLGGWVVAWEDERNLDVDGFPFTSVYASRISPAGQVLDSLPIPVAVGEQARAHDPDLACGPDECLVVWADQRNSLTSDVDIYAARIDASGSVVDPTGITVSAADAAQTRPRVAWDGAAWLVVWQDARNATSDVFGARISSAGIVQDASGILISTDGQASSDETPAVAWDGNRLLVAWIRDGNVVAARLAQDGTVIDAPTNLVVSNAAGAQTSPSVTAAEDGHNFVVSWQDHRSGRSDDVFSAWVSSESGAVLQSGGVPIADGAPEQRVPAIASRGGGSMLVAYEAGQPDGTTRVVARLVQSDALDGAPCSVADECASRQCLDGFCCNRACDTGCESCALPGSEGTCSCTGLATCSSNPSCKKTSGLSCGDAAECQTGFCADGVCCSSACDGGCDTCDSMPGTCTPLPAKAPGKEPACLPGYVCTGAPECPMSCEDDDACAPGYYCSASNECAPFCASDADCPPSTRCDAASGKCVAGATCDGDHVLTLANGDAKDCAPYRCLAEGTCRETCSSTADCSSGNQCDEHGRCGQPLEVVSPDGCACRIIRERSTDGARAWLAALIASACIAAHRARRREARGVEDHRSSGR